MKDVARERVAAWVDALKALALVEELTKDDSEMVDIHELAVVMRAHVDRRVATARAFHDVAVLLEGAGVARDYLSAMRREFAEMDNAALLLSAGFR
jgi:hypothetical protein